MGQAEAKGIIFTAAFEVLGKKIGATKLAELRRAFAGDFGNAISTNQILPVGWYPVAWQSELLGYLQMMVGIPPRQLAMAGVSADFQERYVNLAKDASEPQELRQFALRLVQRYYRGGDVDVDVAERKLVLRLRDWDGFDAVTWEAILGGAQAAMAACGAHQVMCIRDPGKRLSESTLRVTWGTTAKRA